MKFEKNWELLDMKYKTVKLGDYLYIKGRIGWKGLKKREYLNGGDYRIINAESLTRDGIDWSKAGYITKERYDESPEIMLKKDDILISKDGTIGKIGYVENVEKPTSVASGIFVLRNLNNTIINTRFIYHYLESSYFRNFILSRTEGSVIPHLYQKDFVTLDFPLPEIETQNKIVDILDAISHKISINKQINNNLTEQFTTIVDNLISKFENYQEFKLTDIADCQNGKAFYKDGYDDNGAMVIDLGNVNTSATFVKTNSDKYISMSRYNDPKLSKYRVLKDDLVMVMTDRKSTMDLLGKTGKIYQEGLYLLNQRMYRIRAKNNINVNYLYAVLNSSETSAALKEKALGSVQKYVNTGDINELLIKIPSISEMNEIASIIDPIMQMIENNTLENNNLVALRDALLPKLMSGELDLSDIDL